MIRNLFTLLFLSATFFASAQRHITVVQLEASTGSTSSAHERLFHVYSGNNDFDLSYSDDYERSSTTTYSLSFRPVQFSYDGHSYQVGTSFLQSTQEVFARLGRYGRFILPSRAIVSQDDVLEISPYQILLDSGWRTGLQSSAGNRWTYHPEGCDRNYVVAINGEGFIITELGPGYGQPLAFVALDPGDAYPGSIATSSSYESTSISGGLEFVNLNEVIEAVNNRVIEICGETEDCTGTDASHDDLNDLITLADPTFVTAGFNAWINRVGNELRWDRISRSGNTFTLEINAGSDHVGTRTSYDCLEELLAALQ